MRSVLQRPMFLCLIMVGAMGVGFAPAQQPAQPKLVNANKEAATFEGVQGKIVGVKLGAQPWLMQLDPKVEVTFEGTAETDFIQLAQTPLMVRFRADVINRLKKVETPLTELEIVNLNEVNKPGAVNEDQGLGGLSPAPRGGPPPEKTTYTITGPVSAYKNGEMTVNGIKVPVDPMAKVTVKLDGPTALMMTPPQSNAVISYRHYPQQPGKGIIYKLESTGTQPLAAPKKPMPRTPATNAKAKPEPKSEEAKPDAAKPDAAKPEETKPGDAKPAEPELKKQD